MSARKTPMAVYSISLGLSTDEGLHLMAELKEKSPLNAYIPGEAVWLPPWRSPPAVVFRITGRVEARAVRSTKSQYISGTVNS